MKKNGEMFKNIALISQLGISMMVPVFLGVGIGLLNDKHFDIMVFSIILHIFLPFEFQLLENSLHNLP